MKRTTIRNTFAALSVAIVLGSSAAHAGTTDNREIGHSSSAQTESVNLQGIATGLQNGQVGHYAAKVSSAGAGLSTYGDTEFSPR